MFTKISIAIIICILSNILYEIIKYSKFNNMLSKNNSLFYLSNHYFEYYDYKKNSQWNKISICLFISIHFATQGYISTVINNYDIFWPVNIGKKIILLDKGFEYLETYITEKWEVYYEEYNVDGDTRKEYSFYVANKYCAPNKYIAYMDADSIFTMKVSKFMLFDELNKPFFLYTNIIRNKRWNPHYILKFNNSKWGDGMITFPVVIYTKHLNSLNNYLKYIHKSELEIIIDKFYTSQFCVILEYIKKNYKNEYHFSIYEENPIIRCGLHIPYAYGIGKPKKNLYAFNSLINKITYDGICSIFSDIYPQKCLKFNLSDFYNRFYLIDSFKAIIPSYYYKDIANYNNIKKDILVTLKLKKNYS